MRERKEQQGQKQLWWLIDIFIISASAQKPHEDEL
jgi:hypothetical protein